ncbi:MAG: hypothetical protein ITG02_11300 [Patulibacter sp.]|nr:hypothetical protein [Patulibacter sp.]
MILVVAHHLEGGVALAFALPPLILVAAAVIWLRRREPDADQEFDWTDDEGARD